MKILVCIPCLLTGGTEVQTLSLVKALAAADHEVITVCYFEHAGRMVCRYSEAGSKVVCLSTDGKRPQGVWSTITFLYQGLKTVVRSERPDIVHVQYMAPGAIPIILLRLLGVKRILATAHTAADIYSRTGLWLVRALQRHLLTTFTCITERAERSFFGTSQIYTRKIRLAKRGNHVTIYNNLSDYIQIAEVPRIFKPLITIGVVSRLDAIKGMDLVVPAFAKVNRQAPHTRLLIVGDGSLRTMMEQQVEAEKLTELITFIGRQQQESIQEYYDQIDILMMPSRSEGFGLTALEGMARGCVVVASDVGGLPEVVLNGETGLLHASENTDDLAEKVVTLLQQPQRMEQLSVAATKRASLFSGEHYKQQIADLYKAIENSCKH